MEYDVEVEVRTTVRVNAASEEDALDAAERYIDAGGHLAINLAVPICATEA